MMCDYDSEQKKPGGRTLAASGVSSPSGRPMVVTGAAGFIGSHLVDRLLIQGYPVTGIDVFDSWYSPAQKLDNLSAATSNRAFDLRPIDLLTVPHRDLITCFRDVPTVFHLAGRPGVQDSWGAGFEDSCGQNILTTQRVLEAAVDAGVGRVILASSSSIYGDGAAVGSRMVAPISPYGATKAAAEQLALVYGRLGLPVVLMRYFTVFGPRQRPDMAFHRLFAACLGGSPFPRRGTGEQRREFTYVGDAVAATVAASTAPIGDVAGRIFDVGGGCVTSINQVIKVVTSIAGRRPPVEVQPGEPGDPGLTEADLVSTTAALGWQPTTGLRDGLEHQWAWHRDRVDQENLVDRHPKAAPAIATTAHSAVSS